MPSRLRRAARQLEDRGASAVEYGLMAAAIAAVLVVTVFGLGRVVSAAFSQTCATLAVSVPVDGESCGAPAAPGDDDPPADPGVDPVPVVP